MGNIYIATMIDTDFTRRIYYYFASNCLLYELDLLHCHRKLVSFEILIQKNLFVNKTQEEYIMRVRWKDSACVTSKKTIKYRKHYITAYNKDGSLIFRMIITFISPIIVLKMLLISLLVGME